MHHPTDRIKHTTAFVTPVVEHWLEQEIVQWVHHEGSIRRPTELNLAPHLFFKLIIHLRILVGLCNKVKNKCRTHNHCNVPPDLPLSVWMEIYAVSRVESRDSCIRSLHKWTITILKILIMNEWMNECLTTPQLKMKIGYWVSDKWYPHKK